MEFSDEKGSLKTAIENVDAEIRINESSLKLSGVALVTFDQEASGYKAVRTLNGYAPTLLH